jgi:GcrA cell cycle regulator
MLSAPPRAEPDLEPKCKRLEDLPPHGCKWPIGEPRDPGFGFCGRKRLTGKPYCPVHDDLAWRPDSRMRPKDVRNIAKLA